MHRLFQRLHGADRKDADAAAKEVATQGTRVVAVSACLLGERVRYDGDDKYLPEVVDPLIADPAVRVLPLCPEVLGGMGCPRAPVHFMGGDGDTLLDGSGRVPVRVVDDAGNDRTAEMLAGAARADELAGLAGAASAVLKERSPSCGAHAVHRDGQVLPGRGVFAARLSRRLPVVSEEDVLQRRSGCPPTSTT